MVRAGDEKRGTLRRKEVMGMGVQGRRRREMSKIRWLDRVRDDNKERTVGGGECTTVLHGCVYHQTSIHLT